MASSSTSASAVARRTQQCLAELEARYKQTKLLATLILMIGRTGVGKSSLLEDLTGSDGSSQQAVDSVTQEFEIDKAYLGKKEYYIMDTPGFDPGHEQDTFLEIIRGIQAVRMFARVAGILYVTCINQPRFDSFDLKLLNLIHALCGNEYLPRLTFVTTFWTASGETQGATFNRQLELLQRKWKEELGGEQHRLYQHGREYSAGEDTRRLLNWFEDREQIARHAKDMIVRHYSEQSEPRNCHPTPKLLQELDTNTPIHDTEAGKLILPSPTGSNTNHAGASQPRSSDDREGQPTARASSRMESPQRTAEAGTSWSSWLGPIISSLVRNVDVSINVGGPPTGGQTFGMGNAYRGQLNPLSSVDVMKSYGLDSSLGGRQRYAQNHGIGGTPGSAGWNEAIRTHVLRNQGR